MKRNVLAAIKKAKQHITSEIRRLQLELAELQQNCPHDRDRADSVCKVCGLKRNDI